MFELAQAAVNLALAVALAWILLRPKPDLLGERVLSTVIVNLKSGQSFHGVLHSADRAVIVLRNAQAIDPGGPNAPVDGEVILLRGEVDFIQRP